MAHGAPIKGMRDWLLHRLVANYWSLPMVAVVVAPIVGGLGLWLDPRGLTAWIRENGLTPVAAADTAQDLAIAAVGVDAAFITLYFSIVLIVLTLAAGNLGMRLVDRWLDKAVVRVSMSGLAFCLVHAMVVLMAIDPDATLDELPLFSIAAMFALQLVNLGMLGVAAHDLGRTMFVDRSIANLGKEAGQSGIPVKGRPASDGTWAHRITAPREGYVQGIGLARLVDTLSSCGRVRFCVAPGQHVLAGEALVLAETRVADEKAVLRAIPIGAFRSNAESTVFQVRLLVEVAARALSPGINDFYTALACADRLTCAMAAQFALWVEDGEVPVYAKHHAFELPGQDFRGLFAAPMKAFRQAAADYPSVTIRMIDNYARLHRLADRPGLAAYFETQARDLADHAVARTDFAKDIQDIENALEPFGSPQTAMHEVAA